LSGFFCRYSNTVYENREAKASQGGTTENEREYSIFRFYQKVLSNPVIAKSAGSYARELYDRRKAFNIFLSFADMSWNSIPT
jgi:hypothetical protein